MMRPSYGRYAHGAEHAADYKSVSGKRERDELLGKIKKRKCGGVRDENCGGVPVNGKAEHAPRRATPASKARRPRVLTSVVCRHRSNMVGSRGLLPWLALWAVSAGPSGAYKVEKYSIAMPNVRPASVSIHRRRLPLPRPKIRRAPS
jgi:hypothetical protein